MQAQGPDEGERGSAVRRPFRHDGADAFQGAEVHHFQPVRRTDIDEGQRSGWVESHPNRGQADL